MSSGTNIQLPERFNNKTALLTGAASGIGKATALRLAAEGADMMLADIDEEGLQQTQAEIAALGKGNAVHTFKFDATAADQCCELVSKTVERFDKIDVVGNIAGIVSFWHLHETTDELWNRSLQINLTAPMIICREAMPHLIESKGNIINISSTAGLSGQAYNAIYVATKHGIIGLTKSLAVEFASRGVRVNAICPGGVKTAINTKMRWAENMEEKLMDRLMPLLDHMAEPEEIASLFAQMASDESKFVTGAAWTIDGGQLAG